MYPCISELSPSSAQTNPPHALAAQIGRLFTEYASVIVVVEPNGPAEEGKRPERHHPAGLHPPLEEPIESQQAADHTSGRADSPDWLSTHALRLSRALHVG